MARGLPQGLVALLDRPGRSLVFAGTAASLALTPIAFHPALYDDFTLVKQAVLLACAALVLPGLAIEGALPRDRVTRWALLGWTVWLTITLITGIDPLGSLLGVYQYRQGYLTQLCYVVLFMGGLFVAREGQWRVLLAAGLAGLAGTTAYTAIQATGNDPVDWWVDTSARAIGTIGNANELAAYGVIALALAAAGGTATRRGTLAVALVAAAASFIVFESQSRSGLIALAIAIASFPAAAFVARQAGVATLRPLGALLAGTAAGLLLSLLAGGLAGTASRVEAGVAQAGAGGSTRMSLWDGTLHTVLASPVTGFGADGLYLAFPQHRPADLQGAFTDYDLPVQSSHDWLLDTAANEGLPGLALLLTVLGSVAWASVRRARSFRGRTSSTALPHLWTALAGYCVLTLVNPLSLAPQATFFVLLGCLCGLAEPASATAPGRVRVRRGVMTARVVPAAAMAAAAAGLAVLLPMADVRGDDAWGSYAAQDFSRAAERYGDAAALVPFERYYFRREAESLLAAGLRDRTRLAEAEAALVDFDDRFGLSAGEAIALATAKIGQGSPPEDVNPIVDRAVRLNPHGVHMARYAVTLRRAAVSRGRLYYASKDRWVYVEP